MSKRKTITPEDVIQEEIAEIKERQAARTAACTAALDALRKVMETAGANSSGPGPVSVSQSTVEPEEEKEVVPSNGQEGAENVDGGDDWLDLEGAGDGDGGGSPVADIWDEIELEEGEKEGSPL